MCEGLLESPFHPLSNGTLYTLICWKGGRICRIFHSQNMHDCAMATAPSILLLGFGDSYIVAPM